MTKRAWIGLAVLGVAAALTGCGGASASGSGASASDAFITVSVMQRFPNGTSMPVASGAALRGGDAFDLRVRTREDVYLYVVYAGPDGSAHVLVPIDGSYDAVPLAAGHEHVVPGDGEYIVLDDSAGTEELFVVASRERLSEDDDTFLAIRRLATEQPTVATPPPAAEEPVEAAAAESMPAPASGPTQVAMAGQIIRTRALSVQRLTEGDTELRASPDEQGVAIVRFTIDHR